MCRASERQTGPMLTAFGVIVVTFMMVSTRLSDATPGSSSRWPAAAFSPVSTPSWPACGRLGDRGDLGGCRRGALPPGPGVTSGEILKLVALVIPLGLDTFGVACAIALAPQVPYYAVRASWRRLRSPLELAVGATGVPTGDGPNASSCAGFGLPMK